MGTQAPSTHATVAAAAHPEGSGAVGNQRPSGVRRGKRRRPTGGSQKTAGSHHSKRQANPDNEARDYPMRQTLATLPGVNMARIPSPESLENFRKFILAHQPISQSVSQLITFEL